jgi:hypothetical protein
MKKKTELKKQTNTTKNNDKDTKNTSFIEMKFETKIVASVCYKFKDNNRTPLTPSYSYCAEENNLLTGQFTWVTNDMNIT